MRSNESVIPKHNEANRRECERRRAVSEVVTFLFGVRGGELLEEATVISSADTDSSMDPFGNEDIAWLHSQVCSSINT